MAEFKDIKEQKLYETVELGKIDQNGYYRRTPDGEIAKDAEGRPLTKEGIVATPEQLTPRTSSAVRVPYTKDMKAGGVKMGGSPYPGGTGAFEMVGHGQGSVVTPPTGTTTPVTPPEPEPPTDDDE